MVQKRPWLWLAYGTPGLEVCCHSICGLKMAAVGFELLANQVGDGVLGNAIPAGCIRTLGAGVVGMHSSDEKCGIAEGKHLPLAERPYKERVFAFVDFGEWAVLP